MTTGEFGFAEGEEMQDKDIAELNADVYDEEDEESEPLDEESMDLPEGPTDEEGLTPEPQEVGETDAEWLEKHGLLRKGLIESKEDLAKSFRHLETYMSKTRPIDNQPAQPQGDAQAEANSAYQGIIDDIGSGDPVRQATAVYKIASFQNSGVNETLNSVQKQLFLANNPEAKDFEADIEANQARYPGMTLDDAYNLAVGSKKDSIVSQAQTTAAQTERQRQLEKKAQLREKPGGVRTTPATLDKALQLAVQGKTGDDAVKAMDAVLEKYGKGSRD